MHAALTGVVAFLYMTALAATGAALLREFSGAGPLPRWHDHPAPWWCAAGILVAVALLTTWAAGGL